MPQCVPALATEPSRWPVVASTLAADDWLRLHSCRPGYSASDPVPIRAYHDRVMTVVNPMTRLPLLRPVSIFRGLSKQALFSVARKATEVSYPAGSTVVSEGDPGDSMGVIVSGAVDVCKGNHVVASLGTGEYFGELALIDGEARTATVVAKEDLTLLTVKAEEFDILLSDPYFARAVMRNLAQRFREVQNAGLASKI